ncbi:MAG: ATP-binding protein [Pseudomonadota bacterium]
MKRLFVQFLLLLLSILLIWSIIFLSWEDRVYKESLVYDYQSHAELIALTLLEFEDSHDARQRVLALHSGDPSTTVRIVKNKEYSDWLVDLEPLQSVVMTIDISIPSDELSVLAKLSEQESLLLEYTGDADAGYLAYAYAQYLVAPALLILMAYILSRHVFAFLQRLKIAIAEVKNGNYDVTIREPRTLEFKQLRDDFLTLTDQLKEAQINQQVFTGAIGHELRTPLTRMRLALDMLDAETDSAAQAELRGELDSALIEMQLMSEEVVWLAKYNQSGVDFLAESIRLDEFLSELLEELADSRLHLHAREPVTLQIGAALLKHALLNLIGNAQRYANDQIVVAFNSNGLAVQISVEDDGPGILEQHREKIFLPYARIEESRQRDAGGWGLGLAIVSRITKLTGGKCQVSDSELGGAKFTLSWQQA